MISRISKICGIEFRETDNHFCAQSTLDNVVDAMGHLNAIAVSLYTIANNVRFLGCGPRAGFAEIDIPAVQPGSSIMPGKVNPVIAESVTMVCAQVFGNTNSVSFAGATGSYFELNLMMPVVAYNLLQSIDILSNSATNLAIRCISGIEATDNGPAAVNFGLMLCTALSPKIGYDAAAKIAKKAYLEKKSIKEVALRDTELTEEELDVLLNPEAMTDPGKSNNLVSS